jgi:4-hydroxy-2-oxoheptanedioate aldolase
VETRAALDRLEAIAAVDGVDGVFIGPADLHASLGYAGQTAHPDVKTRIDDAIRRIRGSGKAAGVLTSLEADARHWLELGCQFVAVGVDASILARESENLRARF